MGIVSHVISNFSRRPPLSYRASVLAPVAIAFLGMLVWGHHMFISGISPYSAMTFSVLTMSIGIPSAVLTLNWIGTAWQSNRLELTTSMLFSLGFVSLFVTGGLTGLFLGQPEIDAYLHDTAFVVAHFHMIMGLAALFAVFAATFYWFPLLFGRTLNERLGKLHFYLTFIGAYATFLPMHFAGLAGTPRRYSDFTNFDFLQNTMPLQRWITISAFALGAVQLIFLINLFRAILSGQPTQPNPWSGSTLEWLPDNSPASAPYTYPQVKMDIS
jgi:cytochrome c oxidase subunit 1